MKILQERAHKALYLMEKPRAETYVPTTTRISSESDLDKRGLQALECMDLGGEVISELKLDYQQLAG
ncbi:hypothetical protein C5B77_19495 [Aeromonas salmonicida]|nr:hypothetical protein C5B77_19495 [Aeromonas salmonicida]